MIRFIVLFLLSQFLRAASPWQATPPLPPLSSIQRVSELTARRAKLTGQMGPRGMLLLLAAEERPFANDIPFPYREENNFYYLTGIQQTGAALLLIPGAAAETDREFLFLPTKTRSVQIFTGSVLTPQDATSTSGIKKVLSLSDLPGQLSGVLPGAAAALRFIGITGGDSKELSKDESERRQKQYAGFTKAVKEENAEVYLFLPAGPGTIEYRREQSLAAALAATSTGFSVRNAQPLLRQLRLIKSPHEIALVQQAIDISREGFERALALAAPGLNEADLQAEFDYTYTRRHARFGYPSIIGGGVNGTTLHYEENRDPLVDGSLIVIDAGAEYGSYSADVTRTIPVNGKFSPQQAEIYRLVYAAQQASIASARSGLSIGSVAKKDSSSFSGRASEVLREGLLRLGLITKKEDDDQLRIWLPHGVSHQLGMNVHDISKQGLEFAPGMIVTIEPGLYFRPDALESLPKTPENEKLIAAVKPVFEKYKGIGVRIEDDILITEGGAKVLSGKIPSKLEDVEAAMARLRAQKLQAPLP